MARRPGHERYRTGEHGQPHHAELVRQLRHLGTDPLVSEEADDLELDQGVIGGS
jgi:hypothetical protein